MLLFHIKNNSTLKTLQLYSIHTSCSINPFTDYISKKLRTQCGNRTTHPGGAPPLHRQRSRTCNLKFQVYTCSKCCHFLGLVFKGSVAIFLANVTWQVCASCHTSVAKVCHHHLCLPTVSGVFPPQSDLIWDDEDDNNDALTEKDRSLMIDSDLMWLCLK